MNIILVSNNLAKARTLTLTRMHIALFAGGFLVKRCVAGDGTELSFPALRGQD